MTSGLIRGFVSGMKTTTRLLAATCGMLIAAACYGQEPTIGKEFTSGTVRVLVVESVDEVTVFVRSNSCEAIGVSVSVRLDGGFKTQSASRFGCAELRPMKLTFPNEGKKLTAIHVSEVSRISVHTFIP